MNTLILDRHDWEYLFAWKEENKELVRENLVPIKDIEITVSDSKLRIKCYRDDNKLNQHISWNGLNLGVMKWRKHYDGWALTQTNCDIEKYIDKMKLPEDQRALNTNEEFQKDMLTIYGIVMAFMVYGNTPPPEAEMEHTEHSVSRQRAFSNGSRKNKTHKKTESVVYLFRKDRKSIVRQGSHASPDHQFMVRGHWRHYQNGRIIWINQFTKGKGKSKETNYRLGLPKDR